MESPIRLYQKQKDYQRHKLFRKIKRRRERDRKNAINAPIKELRRRMKQPVRFRGGKDQNKGKKYGYDVEYMSEAEAMKQLADNMNRTAVMDEVVVTPSRRLPMQSELSEGITNQAANERADEYANRTSLTPERFLGLMGANIPLAAGALGATVAAPALFDSTIAPLSDYVAGTKAGQAITGLLGNPYFNAAVEAGFAGHGLDHIINEGVDGWGDAAMTALEVAPLGRLAKPVWDASKEGLQYTAKVVDNTARYVSPSYDLYRTIGETTPRTTPTLHSFYSSDLTGSGFVENVYTGSPLFEFGQTMRTSPEKAYFMRAPKDVDILKLENGKFRHEVVGNEIFPSGEVNGKFVSYGEPWKEFALGENSALYEFPVGPRRGPSLMATDWKGREQKYSVDEVYDYMQQEEALRKELASIKETVGDDFLKQYRSIRRNLIDEKYPALKEPIDTSIHGANQTVIPNERWNFDKFLKTPFWKYSENPISGQVQKELMMRWPEAKPLETPTIEWADAASNSGVMADTKDFSFKVGSDLDPFTRYFYNRMIHGYPLKDFSGKTFSSDVKKGISNKTKEEIRNNVVRRNMREFMNDGLTSSEVAPYETKVEELMNDINVGIYSQIDYEKAGWGDFGGFYDPKRNFISINREAEKKGFRVEPHEVRHAIDHNIDDEILTPTSETFGKDFDSDRVLSSMQRTRQKQNMILYDAYDNDFIDIPNKSGYNEGLENYSNMGREAITTNRDAREVLLGSKKDWDPDITDKIIDKVPDTDIFEAVEKANGYGRRFIKFLRENNKLTSKKAQQFREAMKHVGAYAVPVGMTLGTSAIDSKIGYQKGKDKNLQPPKFQKGTDDNRVQVTERTYLLK